MPNVRYGRTVRRRRSSTSRPRQRLAPATAFIPPLTAHLGTGARLIQVFFDIPRSLLRGSVRCKDAPPAPNLAVGTTKNEIAVFVRRPNILLGFFQAFLEMNPLFLAWPVTVHCARRSRTTSASKAERLRTRGTLHFIPLMDRHAGDRPGLR